MFNLSASLSRIKDEILKKPVEIHDIYLGSQTAEDSQTLHFVGYYKQINFFNYTGGIGQSYQPLSIARTAIKKSSKGEIDRVSYKVDNVNRAMSEYAAAIDFRNKRIVSRLLFRDFLDSPDNAKVTFDGIIQNIVFEEKQMVATCVPIIGSLAFETGWPYQIHCNAKFGDEFCGINKNASGNVLSGTATSGSRSTIIDTAGLTQSNDYWNIGEVIMTSGNNVGARRKIIDFDLANNMLIVDFEFNYSIQPGDGYTVFRGCDKRLTTCTNIYNNNANYRGFHAIPLNESSADENNNTGEEDTSGNDTYIPTPIAPFNDSVV